LSLRFARTEIPGVIVVEPQVHRDARGFFLESFHAEKYRAGGIDAVFVQDNHSYSARDTLRGLHAQHPRAQGKLVRAIAGEIWDVAVDVRCGSPTFLRHVGVVLSAANFRQLWVPPGLLHGFVVTSETAEVEYKCSEPYRPEDEFTVVWDDPELAIAWPVASPVLSPRDAAAPRFSQVRDRLLDYQA
jgi:dTDP-4-dehydrorhamnose 3,5-epimerase